jgi:ParB-like chromosome segregation protein Spo0J
LRENGEDERERTMLLKVVVREKNEDEALRAALLTFTQHHTLTPAERARAVTMLRHRHWPGNGPRSLQMVAEHLGVSPATVSQMERYVTQVPQSAKEKVAAGKMEVTTALEVATSPEPLREKVVEEAQRIADEEQASAPAPKQKRTRKPIDKANGAAVQQLAVDINKERQVSAPVKTKHVRAAQRVVAGAMPKLKAPKVAEIVAELQTWVDTDQFPVQVVELAAALIGWCHGRTSTAQVHKRRDTLVEALMMPNALTRSSGETVGRKATMKPQKHSVKSKRAERPAAKQAAAKRKK